MSQFDRLSEEILNLDTLNYPALYLSNAEFHAAIDVMGRVLPVLVRLVADDAIREDQARRMAMGDFGRGL